MSGSSLSSSLTCADHSPGSKNVLTRGRRYETAAPGAAGAVSSANTATVPLVIGIRIERQSGWVIHDQHQPTAWNLGTMNGPSRRKSSTSCSRRLHFFPDELPRVGPLRHRCLLLGVRAAILSSSSSAQGCGKGKRPTSVRRGAEPGHLKNTVTCQRTAASPLQT